MATNDPKTLKTPRSIRLSSYHQWVYRQVHGAMNEKVDKSSAAVTDLIFKLAEDVLRNRKYITEEYRPVALPAEVLNRPQADSHNAAQ